MCSDNSVLNTEAKQPKILTSLTWNCENIKNNIYFLKSVLSSNISADLIFLSEPNIFQSDLMSTISPTREKYCSYLNTDDLYDPELAMIKSRIVGGTLAMWAKHLDPYVTVHPTTTSAFTAIVLQIPGYQVSIHIVCYLPTAGREQDFVSELTNLRICLEDLTEQYPSAILYMRGDSNVNKNNRNRVILLKQFLLKFSLKRVCLEHHFLGEGRYDSDIDVLLHSDLKGVSEEVVSIMCKHDHPTMLSHHDMIVSQCTVPAIPTYSAEKDDLVTAPRLCNNREKIVWSPEGAARYEEILRPVLKSLRESWLDPSSTSSTSVLLQMTNHVLRNAASASNKAVSLSVKTSPRKSRTPWLIRRAEQKLKQDHKKWKRGLTSMSSYNNALKLYKKTVRWVRLEKDFDRDNRLLSILSDNPSSLYSFIKASRNNQPTKIEKLTVQDKVYLGAKVADGFYDAMTALKSCTTAHLEKSEISLVVTQSRLS